VQILYNILLGVAILVAFLFALLVFVTGKGDAMSGGGSIRTTFKGKAGFEDFMSRIILVLGGLFMGLTLLLDVLGNHLPK
jgi:protein translocase SecG subunit